MLLTGDRGQVCGDDPSHRVTDDRDAALIELGVAHLQLLQRGANGGNGVRREVRR